MTPTLYFLRSSENKIVENMLAYAHPHQENRNIYSDFYGLTTKDLGLYALVDNKIAGAIWSREIDETPSISLAVLPEFQNKGIANAMLGQFLQEAAVVYETMKIESYGDANNIKLLEKFGFIAEEDSSLMRIVLEKKELVRPSDGYDPRRWMD
jgi:ribosomal protein S18 acetylase RimI-like enzyme